MVVGEPTLMGGEFGDRDERLIARLENAQYDPTEQPDESSTSLDQPPVSSTSHFLTQPRTATFPPVSQQSWPPFDKIPQTVVNNVAVDKLTSDIE